MILIGDRSRARTSPGAKNYVFKLIPRATLSSHLSLLVPPGPAPRPYPPASRVPPEPYCRYSFIHSSMLCTGYGAKFFLPPLERRPRIVPRSTPGPGSASVRVISTRPATIHELPTERPYSPRLLPAITCEISQNWRGCKRNLNKKPKRILPLYWKISSRETCPNIRPRIWRARIVFDPVLSSDVTECSSTRLCNQHTHFSPRNRDNNIIIVCIRENKQYVYTIIIGLGIYLRTSKWRQLGIPGCKQPLQDQPQMSDDVICW